MATPAKHLRTAVARNRIRRLIRESFRQSNLTIQGVDVVVLARAAAAAATNADISTSLASHWQRVQRAGTGRA